MFLDSEKQPGKTGFCERCPINSLGFSKIKGNVEGGLGDAGEIVEKIEDKLKPGKIEDKKERATWEVALKEKMEEESRKKRNRHQDKLVLSQEEAGEADDMSTAAPDSDPVPPPAEETTGKTTESDGGVDIKV